jgi:hypothetical protein
MSKKCDSTHYVFMAQRALLKIYFLIILKFKIVSYVNKEITYTCEYITHCKPQIYPKKLKPNILMCVQHKKIIQIIYAHMYIDKSQAKIHIQLLGVS